MNFWNKKETISLKYLDIVEIFLFFVLSSSISLIKYFEWYPSKMKMKIITNQINFTKVTYFSWKQSP